MKNSDFHGGSVWILMNVNGITMILGMFFSLTWIVGPSKGMISPKKKTWLQASGEQASGEQAKRSWSSLPRLTITINNHDYELLLTINNHSPLITTIVDHSLRFTTSPGEIASTDLDAGWVDDCQSTRNGASITRPGKH